MRRDRQAPRARVLLLGVLALPMAACSATGTGGGPGDPANLTYQAMFDRGDALVQRLEETTPTPISRVPVSGAARYEGYAAFQHGVGYDYNEDPEMMALARIDTYFASDTVEGEFTNFRNRDGAVIGGSLQLGNGAINGNEVTASTSGPLFETDRTRYVEADVEGLFGGPNVEFLAGTIDATVIEDGYGSDYSGIFVTER